MTRSELKKLIADGETVHLECKLAKTAIPANFWETYSSFANTDGGTILLGVKEENHKFSVVGVDDARKILNDFWNTVHGEKVSAVVVYEHDVRIETVGGKQIVVVEVPRADRADNVTRDDDTRIHRSVREVVANALIHADYHGRQGIVIDKYPKRIEVSNPGILRISKAVAVAGGTSDARNAKIFNIFSLVKIGERSGMGLSQLYGNWEEAGYARPQLSESFNPERTKVEIEVEVTEKVTEKLSETDERIIALIQSNPHITQKMLSEAIGLTRPYIGRKLLELQVRNIIRRIGPDKGGYWEMLGRVNN